MIYEEYKQLSAYARYDGFYLSILWVASFACTLGASLLPLLGHFSTLLLFSSPFFVAYRLRLFRDEGRNGIISYGRGLFYCLRVFFNASVLFSLLQWLYMSYLDNGRIYRMMTTLFSSQEGRQALPDFGLSYDQFQSTLPDILQPTFFASVSFIYSIIIGVFCSLIIAAVMTRTVKRAK